MGFSLQNHRQLSHIGHEPELNGPMTRVMTAVVILRLGVFAVLLLTGALVYAVLDAALRGLILILALVVFVSGLLLYQVIRLITAYTPTNDAATVRNC